MKKINIYAIHSSKMNYKEEFYKPLLLSQECSKHHLILPLTEKYQNTYAKDLVEASDFIIINLTDSTPSVFIETMWALKANKKILFLIKEKAKCFILLNKYKKLSQSYINIEQEKDIIDTFIKQHIDEITSKDESGTINLGSIDKKN